MKYFCIGSKFKFLFKSLNTSLLKIFLLKLITFSATSNWSLILSSIFLCSWKRFSWILLRSLLLWVSLYLVYWVSGPLFVAEAAFLFFFFILLWWIVFCLINICSFCCYLLLSFCCFSCCLSSLTLLVLEIFRDRFFPWCRCLLAGLVELCWV